MKNPELLLLPIMMLADYLLTVAGARLRERHYSHHFKLDHYELNPIWQKEISKKRWFNPRHLVIIMVVVPGLLYVLEWGTLPHEFVRGVAGCLLVLFGMIIGRHLSNLLIFQYLSRRPTEVAGQVVLAHCFVLYLSLSQTLAVIIPVGLIAFFAPSAFAIGGLLGLLLFLILNGVWIKRARSQESRKKRVNQDNS